jgi:hypothetical protein
MVFINQEDLLGIVIAYLTYNVTGSIFLTLLFLFMVILLGALAMRIPLELTAILVLPLVIVLMSQYSGEWQSIAGAFILYLGVIMARFWMKG